MTTRTDAMTEASAPTHLHDTSYVDWPAIFAGAVIAAGVAFVFSTFGAAVGVASIGVNEAGDGPSTGKLIAIATWIVWTAVSSVMVGGYVTGRMRRRIDPAASSDAVAVRDGIHGLVVWGVAVLLAAWVLGGATSTVATSAGAAAPGIAAVVSGDNAAAPATTGGTAATAPATTAPQPTQAEIDAAQRKTKVYTVLSAFATAASLMVAAAGGYWAAGMGGRHRDENRVFARFGTWQ